jgi:hypothetical protein
MKYIDTEAQRIFSASVRVASVVETVHPEPSLPLLPPYARPTLPPPVPRDRIDRSPMRGEGETMSACIAGVGDCRWGGVRLLRWTIRQKCECLLLLSSLSVRLETS